ncbi:MAG: asparaginase [Acidobacteriota bacterium]
MSASKENRVLIINTGGTIAMVHEDNNPLNPLKPGKWDEITKNYPVLKQLKEKNIETDIHTFDPLLDSSNISHENWKQMAEVISSNYDQFTGFVILHGTDTMCYTASALSFMLEHLSKPVILTGSQLPLAVPRSDALENFVTALSIAAGVDVNDGSTIPLVPEVCIYFRGKLLRGNRARKLSSSAYSGFESPNYPPLGTVGEHIELDTRLIRTPGPEQLFANTEFVTQVMALDIFPSLDPEIVVRVATESASGKKIRALILKTYGTGNAPSNEDFLRAIEQIVNAGLLVVDVTQCPQGMVEIGQYEASVPLLERGVISGLDMTPESALCKLMWLLGMGWDLDQVRKQMQLDQRGEQSLNIFEIDYGPGSASPVFSSQQVIPGEVEFEKLEVAILRLQGTSLLTEDKGDRRLSLRVYVNYQNLQESSGTEIIQYAGTCEKTIETTGQKASLFLDVTSSVRKFFTKGKPGRIGLVTNGSSGAEWEKLNLALYVKA